MSRSRHLAFTHIRAAAVQHSVRPSLSRAVLSSLRHRPCCRSVRVSPYHSSLYRYFPMQPQSSPPPTMRAIVLTHFLSDSELPTLSLSSSLRPNPLLNVLSPSEVVVRVVCAGVNPADVKAILGQMPHATLPRVVGRDYSGVVVKTGEDCKEWLGRSVFGTGGELGHLVDGSHAQYLRLQATAVTEKPASLTFEAAACIGVNFVTAYSGLHYVGQLTAADSVLITGASGGVGTAVRQLAKAAGATVITVDRTRPPSEHSSSSATAKEGDENCAADYAIYLSELTKGFTDLPKAVAALPLFSSEAEDVHSVSSFSSSSNGFVPRGRGASLVFDSLGGASLVPLLHCVASNGRLVNISTAKGVPVTIDLHDLYRRQVQLRGANSLYLDSQQSAVVLRLLTPLFDSGRLTPVAISQRVIVGKFVDAEGVNTVGQTYAQVYKGVRGKVVMVFDEELAGKR